MSVVLESVVGTVKERLPFRLGAQGSFFEARPWAQRECHAAMEAAVSSPWRIASQTTCLESLP